jgi:hypothetical protein
MTATNRNRSGYIAKFVKRTSVLANNGNTVAEHSFMARITGIPADLAQVREIKVGDIVIVNAPYSPAAGDCVVPPQQIVAVLPQE